MAKSNNNTPFDGDHSSIKSTGVDKSENSRTLFSEVINRSTYSYAKFREAGDRLAAAQNDLLRSKAENLAFPKVHDRSRIRYNAAKQDYDKALQERDDASRALDLVFSKIAYKSDHLEASEYPLTTVSTSAEHANIFTSQMKEAESSIKNVHEESDNLSKLVKGTAQDNLAIRETIQGIQKIIQEIQATQEGIRLDITRLDQNHHDLQRAVDQAISQPKEEITYTQELEATRVDLTDTNRQVEDLGNRQALETAQKAFEKIYERLEIVEECQLVEHPPDNVPAIKDLDERLNSIESRISTVQEIQASAQSFQDIFFGNGSVPNSQTYLQKLQGEIQENIMSKMAPLEENVSSKLKQYSESLADANLLANDFRQQIQALDIVRNTVTRMQETNTSVHERVAVVDDQVRGLIMTVQHINKKFDEFSTDEIVMKVNMSLRNASNKSVQSLTTQLQSMSRTLSEKLDAVEHFEKRLRAIESTAYPVTHQNINSLPTG
ncbi:hypothetical protein AA313_de0209016 [Arthrobotrys entomopaga]|nr:hypothetical protein AA313_de0209016 [Arthrobotrys entomopaga]